MFRATSLLRLPILLVATLLPEAPAEAQVSFLGSEFQVNTYTTDSQRPSALAMSASGEFVVWASYRQDGFPLDGIFAQRYDSAGAALGSEF